jgi:hypothetical protein
MKAAKPLRKKRSLAIVVVPYCSCFLRLLSTVVLFRFYALLFLSIVAIRDQGTIAISGGDVCSGVLWSPLKIT